MFFSNELIGEEYKKNIDWTKFQAFSFSAPISPWKWTANNERDIFLVPLGGCGPDGERPEVYALYAQGFLVRFEAWITGTGVGKFWDTLSWNIKNVSIPAELKHRQDEIYSLICDAARAHGRFFDTEHIRGVNVNIEK